MAADQISSAFPLLAALSQPTSGQQTADSGSSNPFGGLISGIFSQALSNFGGAGAVASPDHGHHHGGEEDRFPGIGGKNSIINKFLASTTTTTTTTTTMRTTTLSKAKAAASTSKNLNTGTGKPVTISSKLLLDSSSSTTAPTVTTTASSILNSAIGV